MVEALSNQFDKVTSRDDLEANRNAMGKEGVKSEDRNGSGESDDEAESDSEQGKQASKDAKRGKQEGKKGEGGQNKSEDGGKNDSKDKGKQEGDNDEDSDKGRPDSNRGERERQDGEKEDSEGGESESESGDQQEGDNEDGQNDDKNDNESNQSGSKPQPLPKPPELNPLKNLSLPPLPKIVYFVIVGIAILVVMYFYGRQILAAIRAFIRDIGEFFRRLFGGKEREESHEEEEIAPKAPVPRPFRSFKNPFTTGQASRLSPQQLVAYSFEALQAWAYEQQCARNDDQTPLEFAGQVSSAHKAVGPHARNLAVLYNQAAYAPQSLGQETVKHVQALWQALE